MKNILSLVCVFIVLPILSYGQNEIMGQNENLKLKLVDDILIQENKEFFSSIRDMTINEDNFFLATHSPSMVLKYKNNGKQISKVSNFGRGPFEYDSPKVLQALNDNLIVWDAGNLKFIVYGNDGSKISELSGIKEALDEFKYSGKNIIVYRGGKIDLQYIGIYSVKNKKSLELIHELGTRDEKQNYLSRYTGTAPLALKDGTIYYGKGSTPTLNIYNLGDNTGKELKIEDQDFSVSDDLPETTWEKRNYIFTNSRFKDIYALKKFLVVEMQHGNLFDQTRTTKLHIYDYNLRKIDTIILNHKNMFRMGNGIIEANNNRLYFFNNYADFTNNKGELLEGQYDIEYPENYQRKLSIWEIQ